MTPKSVFCPALLFLGLAPTVLAAPKSVRVSLTNPLDAARPNEPVVLSVADIRRVAPDFNPGAFVVELADPSGPNRQRALPSQTDDVNGDGTADEIAFLVDMAPRDRRQAVLVYGTPEEIAPRRVAFPKRAHAAFQRKYEGMGWESERVAWRMYFDERNAFDMYGKLQHVMALDYFAQPAVDYHAESPIGRDTFKIGAALGIGSVGAYVDGKTVKMSNVLNRSWKVVSDGPVRAIADLIYTGWNVAGRNVDLTSRLTVWGGHHWFDHTVTARDAANLAIVTSLPRKPGVASLSGTWSGGADRFVYVATWGPQVLRPGATATEALPDQNLGLGVIVTAAAGAALENLPDPDQELVRPPLTTSNGVSTARWRVVSAWDQEAPDGDSVPGLDAALTVPAAVRSRVAWARYVEHLGQRAARPLEVRLQP